jgi:hypothetical protein
MSYSELKQELQGIGWYVLLMFLCVTSLATIYPSIIGEYFPENLSKATWLGIVNTTGNIIYLIGTFSTLGSQSKDSVHFSLAFLSFFASLYIGLAFTEVLPGNHSSEGDTWLYFIILNMAVKYQVGLFINYSVTIVIRKTASKLATTLINSAVFGGYLFGCFLAIICAEHKKSIHSK